MPRPRVSPVRTHLDHEVAAADARLNPHPAQRLVERVYTHRVEQTVGCGGRGGASATWSVDPHAPHGSRVLSAFSGTGGPGHEKCPSPGAGGRPRGATHTHARAPAPREEGLEALLGEEGGHVFRPEEHPRHWLAGGDIHGAAHKDHAQRVAVLRLRTPQGVRRARAGGQQCRVTRGRWPPCRSARPDGRCDRPAA